MERTTIRLPTELLDRARKKAAAEGRTLTSMIEEGLRSVLTGGQSKGRPKRPPVVLPVSSATGGLLSAFQREEFVRDAQDIDDLDYAERLRNGFK